MSKEQVQVLLYCSMLNADAVKEVQVSGRKLEWKDIIF